MKSNKLQYPNYPNYQRIRNKFIKLKGFSQPEENEINEILYSLYKSAHPSHNSTKEGPRISSYLRNLVDKFPSKRNDKKLIYQKTELVSHAIPVRKKVFLNPAIHEETYYFDKHGGVHQFDYSRVVIHETIHALMMIWDDFTLSSESPAGKKIQTFDPKGETVIWTNEIVDSPKRATYKGFIWGESLKKKSYDFLGGQKKNLQNIIVTYGSNSKEGSEWDKISNSTRIDARNFQDNNSKSTINLIIAAGKNKNYKFSGGSRYDCLHGNNLRDEISGGDGNDRIYGNEGDDLLTAYRGNKRAVYPYYESLRTAWWIIPDKSYIVDDSHYPDNQSSDKQFADTFIGGAGDDIIVGNKEPWKRTYGRNIGQDVAIYSGNLKDYTIFDALILDIDGAYDNQADIYFIHDNREGSPDGHDVLQNVELVRFADTPIKQALPVEYALRCTIGREEYCTLGDEQQSPIGTGGDSDDNDDDILICGDIGLESSEKYFAEYYDSQRIGYINTELPFSINILHGHDNLIFEKSNGNQTLSVSIPEDTKELRIDYDFVINFKDNAHHERYMGTVYGKSYKEFFQGLSGCDKGREMEKQGYSRLELTEMGYELSCFMIPPKASVIRRDKECDKLENLVYRMSAENTI